MAVGCGPDRIEAEPGKPVPFPGKVITMVVAKSSSKPVAFCESNISGAILVKENVNSLLPSEVSDPQARLILSNPTKQSKLISIAFSRKPFDLIGSPENSETRNQHFSDLAPN
ncbi:hypothetical protein C8J34_10220 [Rhizobium sp. PP-F2F-G36]|nr:hypothetical protein C8J34_10220 [Rhizobium sp. PP-F2F-G36]